MWPLGSTLLGALDAHTPALDLPRVRVVLARVLVRAASAGVSAACDGCPAGLSAEIAFISTQAEYTPPVIFSETERAKLVYRVEAIPEDPARFHPGQPVQVRLDR